MVTRNDVAKHAGVSNTTVSRVLNNNGYVSPESRQRVETAIRELGYTPNLIARSLKTKKSGQLLYCVTEYDNPFYMEVYSGMEAYAQKYGYTIVVASNFDASLISQRQFDGIVLTSISYAQQKELERLDIPVIVNNYTANSYTFPSIKIDIESGALTALEYLYSNGHEKIAFITSPCGPQEQRYLSYQKFMKRNGFSSHIFECSDSISHFEQGYRGGIQLIDSGIPFTAAFIFNDALAVGTIAAFAKYGISVPRDISVISFDNILQSAYTLPALTTVDIPKYELGEKSIKMLIKKLQGAPVESQILQTRLIERNSVKPRNRLK